MVANAFNDSNRTRVPDREPLTRPPCGKQPARRSPYNATLPRMTGIRNFRGIEPDTMYCIGLKELPDALPQDGTNQDVGVQNDHFSGWQPFFHGASV